MRPRDAPARGVAHPPRRGRQPRGRRAAPPGTPPPPPAEAAAPRRGGGRPTLPRPRPDRGRPRAGSRDRRGRRIGAPTGRRGGPPGIGPAPGRRARSTPSPSRRRGPSDGGVSPDALVSPGGHAVPRPGRRRDRGCTGGSGPRFVDRVQRPRPPDRRPGTGRTAGAGNRKPAPPGDPWVHPGTMVDARSARPQDASTPGTPRPCRTPSRGGFRSGHGASHTGA